MGLKAKEVYFTHMSGLPASDGSGDLHIINYAVNLWIRACPRWLSRSFGEDFIWLMNGVELHLLSRRDKDTIVETVTAGRKTQRMCDVFVQSYWK